MGFVKGGHVYIMANKRNGTLYLGSASQLVTRVLQHKHDLIDGFTKRYGLHSLVWYESHEDIENAILRELQMKKWNRSWKLRVIEEMNPKWKDLYDEIC